MLSSRISTRICRRPVLIATRCRPALHAQPRQPLFVTQSAITRPESAVHGSSDSVTVYATGLDFDVKEEAVKELFAPFGAISTRLARTGERGKGVFKGHAYVVMSEAGADAAAKALNGAEVHGRPINVERRSKDRQPRRRAADAAVDTSADEVPADEASSAEGASEPAAAEAKLYVSNLSYSSISTEEDVKQIFEPFGSVTKVTLGMTRNATKQRAWVTVPAANANNAIATLNGSEYDGCRIAVKLSDSPSRTVPS